VKSPIHGGSRLLAAPDKFRGSLSAADAARAIADGAARAGWSAHELPLADGGEGTLDVLGGGNRSSVVTGPLRRPVQACWRLADGIAVVEMAKASGLLLVGGCEGNDPVAATTRGTGELIAEALDRGAECVLVAVGGSATSDGGLGAVEVLRDLAPFDVPVRVACDVETRFVDAAAAYGPQKGAGPAEVEILTARLHELVARYRDEFGVDVSLVRGGGAAGGLAGGLAALGAELVPGFELVASAVGLDAALDGVDGVVTGEGLVDSTSFSGKVVGGVIARAAERGVRAFIVAGGVTPGVVLPVPTVSLLDRFGAGLAWRDPEEAVARAVAATLAELAVPV